MLTNSCDDMKDCCMQRTTALQEVKDLWHTYDDGPPLSVLEERDAASDPGLSGEGGKKYEI